MTQPTGSSGRPLAVTQEQLRLIVPWVQVPAGTSDEVNQVVGKAGIHTHLELAHFIAQCAYESGYFGTKSRVPYEEPPVAGRYEFRMDLGNVSPGDGQRFRGRGAIQLTGRRNYTAFNDWMHSPAQDDLQLDAPWDVIVHPEVVATAPYRWLAAAWYWVTHPLLAHFADNDDVAGCTRIITGAKVPGPDQGLSSRERITDLAIQVLG